MDTNAVMCENNEATLSLRQYGTDLLYEVKKGSLGEKKKPLSELCSV